jgi:amidase
MPHTSVPHGSCRWVGYTKVWNLLDYPAMVIPAGAVCDKDISDIWSYEPHNVLDEWNKRLWNDNKEVMASLRLPVGIQIIGRRYDDEKVLAAAKVLDDLLRE